MLDDAADKLLELVDEEVKRLPKDYQSTSNIVIGGFGQGAAVCLAAYLKHKGPESLGGVMSLSGMQCYSDYLPDGSINIADDMKIRRNTPMFIFHGKDDEKIPFENAKLSYEYITESLYKFNYKEKLLLLYQDKARSELTPMEITKFG